MYKIVLSSVFQKQVEKLIRRDPKLKNRLSKTLKYLHKDLNHPSLRLHKLTGTDNWSVSVTDDIRIIIHWEDDYLFCTRIGTHDEVY